MASKQVTMSYWGGGSDLLDVYVTFSDTAVVSSNSTNISYTFYAKSKTGAAPYISNIEAYAVVNGYKGGTYYRISDEEHDNFTSTAISGSYKAIGSSVVKVPHNPDGSFSYYDTTILFTLTTSGGIYTSGQVAITINSMNIRANITSAENFSDDYNPTIKYNNPASLPISACIADENGREIFVPYRTIATNGSSYTFTLTAAEKQTLIDNTDPEGKLAVRFYVKTTLSDGSFLLSSIAKVFSIDAKPIVNYSIIDVDDVTTGLTGNNKVFIRYFSDASIIIDAEAQKGATIKALSATCGDKTSTGQYASIQNVESGTFIISATDSRGSVTEVVEEMELIPYNKLTCNIRANINVDGTATLTIEGTYYNHSFGKEHNSLLVQWRRTKEDGSWQSSWEGIDYYSDDDTFKLTKTYTDLDYRTEYKFEARAIDRLDTVYSEQFKFKVTPVFDWGEDDFNFNCDVNVNGKFTINGEELDFSQEDEAADRVIETGTEAMGTNGTWYWRKWASGKAECYGKRNYGNMGVSTAWGNWYSSADFNQSLPSGLFADVPEVIQINIVGTNKGALIMQGYSLDDNTPAATANTTGSFCVIRAGSATLSQVYLGFNVIGRWK